ncbi:hypothetical protein GJAV_G00196950 [Gymnothorax javanicus]|nr:hypothetical protein GJAV_G00196950 [Gymnothorax javanicus]
MSGGKKKSGFQITSVTTDYGQVSTEPQKSSYAGDASGPLPRQVSPGKAVTNGGMGTALSPSLPTSQPGHAHGSPLGRVAVEGGGGTTDTRIPSLDPSASGIGYIPSVGLMGVSVANRVPNGPALLDPIITHQNHTSVSQPGSPVSRRKQLSHDHGGSSRFRVVRLGQGLGEPYRRGRWTCVDYMEREGVEERGLRRVMDSMRHAHSLESLETAGISGFEGGGGGTILKPLGHNIRALRSGHLVHSQGTTHLLAPHVDVDVGGARKPLGEGAAPADSPKGGPASKPPTVSSGPPSPTHKDHARLKLGGSPTSDPSHSPSTPAASPQARLLSPTKNPADYARPRLVPSPLRLDVDTAGKSLLRETRSQPTSPSSILPRDRGFHRTTTPINTPSALSLAQSVLGVGGAFDLGDGSGSSNSMIAIDNKIEQAMDLVKTHLMMAVREETSRQRDHERGDDMLTQTRLLRTLPQCSKEWSVDRGPFS